MRNKYNFIYISQLCSGIQMFLGAHSGCACSQHPVTRSIASKTKLIFFALKSTTAKFGESG